MKILIVNGFRENEPFIVLQQMIYQIFKEESHLVDTEIEFYVRSLRNLDDVLYEVNSSFTKRESAKNFDMMDIVIVLGEANILPWSMQAKKLMLLLIMCFRTNKIVFCAGLGMTMLIYLSASNFEKYYPVEQLKEGGSKDCLQLDPVTGDLFQISEEGTLLGHGNVGLHQRKAAQEFQLMGKYIMQAPVYHPNQLKEIYGFYFNHANELICYLKKRYLHHWALIDVPMEFKVETLNTWDIHKFTFMNSSKKFNVLAEGSRGVLIAEFNSMLGMLFIPSKKYPGTMTILRNFIKRYCELFKAQQVHVKNIDEVKILQSQDYNRNEIFKHSGLAANTKYQKFVVTNNAIDIGLTRRNPHLFKKQKSKEITSNSGHVMESKVLIDSYYQEKTPEPKPSHGILQNKLQNPSGPRQIRQFLHPRINQEALDNMAVTVVPGVWTGRQTSSEERQPIKQNAMKFSKVKYDESNLATFVKDTRTSSASAPKKFTKQTRFANSRDSIRRVKHIEI